MGLWRIKLGGVCWIYLAHSSDLMVGCCQHTNEPLGSIICREFLLSILFINFSQTTLYHGLCYFTGLWH
jgi:hypothetical protein